MLFTCFFNIIIVAKRFNVTAGSSVRVDLGDFGKELKLGISPNLKVLLRTHRHLYPKEPGQDDIAMADAEENADNDENPDGHNKRALKKRRSEVHGLDELGKKLPSWVCSQIQGMFGEEIQATYKVRGKNLQKRTSFHLSEICCSATL